MPIVIFSSKTETSCRRRCAPLRAPRARFVSG
jgi:hypothetical protein